MSHDVVGLRRVMFKDVPSSWNNWTGILFDLSFRRGSKLLRLLNWSERSWTSSGVSCSRFVFPKCRGPTKNPIGKITLPLSLEKNPKRFFIFSIAPVGSRGFPNRGYQRERARVRGCTCPVHAVFHKESQQKWLSQVVDTSCTRLYVRNQPACPSMVPRVSAGCSW